MKSLLLLLLIIQMSACSSDSPTESTLPDAMAFTLTDVDGQTVSLSDFGSNVVVLNFFATWCGPCQEEMPKLESNIWQAYRDRDVVVLGIDLKEDLGQVKLFAVNNGITFRLAIDGSGAVFRAYAGGDGVANVPYNVIIDKNGKVRYSQTGYNEQEMITLIDALL